MKVQELFERLTQKPERPFEVGDIAVWKDGLKDRRFPEYDQPVIVTEVLETPIADGELKAGSPYYGIMYDIKVGVLHCDEFIELHMDSRRFQLYEPEVANEQ